MTVPATSDDAYVAFIVDSGRFAGKEDGGIDESKVKASRKTLRFGPEFPATVLLVVAEGT